MNIIKLTEGIKETGDGLQGCALAGRPIYDDVILHKKELDEEKATNTKKALFLTGFALMHILEKWKDIKGPVLETVAGVREIAQAIKEQGMSTEDYNREKEKIQEKARLKCAALPPAKITEDVVVKDEPVIIAQDPNLPQLQ